LIKVFEIFSLSHRAFRPIKEHVLSKAAFEPRYANEN